MTMNYEGLDSEAHCNCRPLKRPRETKLIPNMDALGEKNSDSETGTEGVGHFGEGDKPFRSTCRSQAQTNHRRPSNCIRFRGVAARRHTQHLHTHDRKKKKDAASLPVADGRTASRWFRTARVMSPSTAAVAAALPPCTDVGRRVVRLGRYLRRQSLTVGISPSDGRSTIGLIPFPFS